MKKQEVQTSPAKLRQPYRTEALVAQKKKKKETKPPDRVGDHSQTHTIINQAGRCHKKRFWFQTGAKAHGTVKDQEKGKKTDPSCYNSRQRCLRRMNQMVRDRQNANQASRENANKHMLRNTNCRRQQRNRDLSLELEGGAGEFRNSSACRNKAKNRQKGAGGD